jgi:imidazolonepropionase-like amidohydrolase
LNLNQRGTIDALKMAARSRVVLTPTAVVVEPLESKRNHMEEQKKYYTAEAWAQIEKRLKNPIFTQGEKMLEKNKEFIRLAYKQGCILSTGTDHVDFALLPGYSLWREMEIFAEAGLSPLEVLKAATFNGAFALGRTDLLGSIENGKLADLVVLNANPLSNISNVRQVHRVIKEGIIYEPDVLLNPLIGKYY